MFASKMRRRRAGVLIGAAIAAASLAGVAAADDVVNSLDASVDATAEIMPLAVGGGSGSTSLYVVERKGDGKNGCNLTGQSTLTLAVTSSDPAVATVSPSSVTFTSCDDRKTVTVTPQGTGNASISARQTSNTTTGTFSLAEASFTVAVAPPPNTPPTVRVAGVTGGAVYDKGSVPAATCEVSDAEDGASSFAARLSAASGADGTGTQTASCSYTDGGGVTVAASETYEIVDPNTPPQVSVAGVSDGASYDKGSVPSATCEVIDAQDGSSSFPATLSAVSGPYAVDGIGSQTASCSYTDAGGLQAGASATYTIVDPTAPEISSLLSPASPDGDNGWYRGDVDLTWTVREPESPSSLQVTGCEDQHVAADQAATAYPCSATSAGGAADPASVTIKRDATAPENVAFDSDVAADGARYFPTTVPSGTGCTADDATSGLASCVVTGRSTAVGTHTLTATATDQAGNTATATRTYRVRTLTVSGFFQPVDMGGAVNTVRGGATVPLKFDVSDEGVEQTATGVVRSFVQRTVTCGALSGVLDEVELVTTGATTLRYDATAGQFVQNWQTPKAPGTCLQAEVTMIDGTAITASFKLK